MSTDIELLSSCGLRFESEICSDGGYCLCRVDYQGRKLVAEISGLTGVYQHRWPSVAGLVSPLSARDLPGSGRLLLFDTGDGKFLSEYTKTAGGFSEKRAVELTKKIAVIVSALQSAGVVCGYLGPEMFFTQNSGIFMLAGRRGVPVSSFTAPEARAGRPSDPRSDVSALGSLLFRLIAGTDDSAGQLRAWNELSPPLRGAIGKMVAPSPVDRPSGIAEVSVILERIGDNPEAAVEHGEPAGSVEKGITRVKKSGSKKIYWIVGLILLSVLALGVYFIPDLPPEEGGAGALSAPFPDTVAESRDSVPPVPPNEHLSAEESVSVQTPPETLFEDSAVVWVSNCSGVPGLEHEFRAGPLKDYSFVFPTVGTTLRRSSLILVVRDDPQVSMVETDAGRVASLMADTTFVVKPTDLTAMLGTDLRFAGINSQFLHAPAGLPAGTLYVDVVNHGIQYLLDGTTAAAWFAGKIDGKACTIDGAEWIVVVSDIRDSDKFSEDIGIPALLEKTIFLHKPQNRQAATLETRLRQYFRALPTEAGFSVDSVPVPDLHVLIGG